MAMSTREQDLMERFKKLDITTQERLLALVEEQKGQTDFNQLMKDMDEFRERLVTKYGEGHFMSAVDMVREVREEHENDLMDSF
jgi:Zn-dependent oligopeptidase